MGDVVTLVWTPSPSHHARGRDLGAFAMVGADADGRKLLPSRTH